MSLLEKALEKSNALSGEENKQPDSQVSSNEDADLSVAHEVDKPEVNQQKSVQDRIKFDWNSLAEKGFISLAQDSNQISEEYRTIKRPLVDNALGVRKKDIERSNLILVTSSIPGEGKTYTSINLAFSIAAELDKKVLLIDADVAKPSISKTLGIDKKIGLIDYLEDDSIQLTDVILQTEIPGLRIITSGKTHLYSTELLASNRMLSLSQELSERYADRIVIFDTPPLLATTQAEVLAAQMGQIILVIAAESTSQHLVAESAKKLEHCPGVVLSLLNKATRNLSPGYYGYGYY